MVTFTRPAASLQLRACVCTSPPPFIRNTPNKGCQSRPGAATSQGEPVSPEGTLEGNKDYLPPSSHSHHPAPRKLRLLSYGKCRTVAQRAEVPIRERITESPDLTIFPKKSATFLEISGFLLFTVIFCSHYLLFVAKLLQILTPP